MLLCTKANQLQIYQNQTVYDLKSLDYGFVPTSLDLEILPF